MIYIRRSLQDWAEVIATFDGKYVRDTCGNVLYHLDGDCIRKGYSSYGRIVYTIEGNCIYDGSRLKYSVHGDRVVEGGQSWGAIVYSLYDH